MQSTSRAEAERLLGIAEKLLQGKDLNGCRDFALLAQETEPLLDGSDQILAVVDVLLAADKRINSHPDWYGILQLESRRNDDVELIKRQYRRLALLLHPDKNKYPFADAAFKLVADAWALFSDSARKTAYDNDLFAFSKVDLAKIPVRRNPSTASAVVNIWTACPYCYNLYEYAKAYEGCCLRCGNCKRAFQAVAIPPASLPEIIAGKEAYYCCWGYFPMGFAPANSEAVKNVVVSSMPPMFPTNPKSWPAPDSLPDVGRVAVAEQVPTPVPVSVPSPVPAPAPAQPRSEPTVQKKPAPVPVSTAGGTVPRKRGRPRKNPLA